MNSKIEGICELICLAYGDRFENLDPQHQNQVKTYAESINTYVEKSRR